MTVSIVAVFAVAFVAILLVLAGEVTLHRKNQQHPGRARRSLPILTFLPFSMAKSRPAVQVGSTPVRAFAATMVRFSRNSLTSTQKPGRQRPFAAHPNRTCRSSSAEVSTLTGEQSSNPPFCQYILLPAVSWIRASPPPGSVLMFNSDGEPMVRIHLSPAKSSGANLTFLKAGCRSNGAVSKFSPARAVSFHSVPGGLFLNRLGAGVFPSRRAQFHPVSARLGPKLGPLFSLQPKGPLKAYASGGRSAIVICRRRADGFPAISPARSIRRLIASSSHCRSAAVNSVPAPFALRASVPPFSPASSPTLFSTVLATANRVAAPLRPPPLFSSQVRQVFAASGNVLRLRRYWL